MSWTVTLLRSVGQDGLLIENAQTLQRELTRCHEEREEEEARLRLEALEELFREDTPGIEDLLEHTTLYLYGSCLICGTLSQKCRDLSVPVLQIMSNRGPAREVFTGWTDGLSILLERATVAEMTSMLEIALHLLPLCVQRIQRKRQRFISIGLELMHKMAKKLLEECEDLAASEYDPSICVFLRKGQEMLGDERSGTLSEEMMAFVALLSRCLLSVMIWQQQSTEDGGSRMEQELETEFGSILRELSFPQRSIEESVFHMALAWNPSARDEDETAGQKVSEIERELRLGCGLLQWAASLYPNIPQLFTDDGLSSVQALLDVNSSMSQAPCISAALHMIPIVLEKALPSDVGKLRELCLKLIDHMQLHPVPAIKAQAADRLSLLLKSCNADVKWQLLKDLVFVPFSDIAALMVQHLRQSITSAWNTRCSDSVFASPLVVDLLKKLVREKENTAELIERAELYSAVLNLYLFLLVRDAKEQPPVLGILEPTALEAMKTRLRTMQQDIHAALDQEPREEMRLLRLQFVVDIVLEQLHK